MKWHVPAMLEVTTILPFVARMCGKASLVNKTCDVKLTSITLAILSAVMSAMEPEGIMP